MDLVENRLSACILCKNEQERLGNCLASVAFADEIVVLDSGSTDDTLDIARRFTEKVFIHNDWPGFGEQRRRAEELAGNDWILMIDSDEVVSEPLRREIQKSLATATPEQVFRINRLTFFYGRFIRHSGWYPDKISRLYNKRRYRYDRKQVHESLDCKGAESIDLSGDLLHYTAVDLSEYLHKRLQYAEAWAEEHHAKGRNSCLLQAVVSSGFAFIRHYFLRAGFLDGKAGFLIAMIQMQYTFNKYILLLMKHRTAERPCG